MAPVHGSCLCGGVAFEMTTPPRLVLHCHCSRCRKARGTAHATNLLTASSGVRFTRGEGLIVRFRLPGAKRFAHAFCKTCGSSMPNVDHENKIAIVPMGSFDDDPGARPEGHIWVASKAPWSEITDDLPRSEGSPSTPIVPD